MTRRLSGTPVAILVVLELSFEKISLHDINAYTAMERGGDQSYPRARAAHSKIRIPLAIAFLILVAVIHTVKREQNVIKTLTVEWRSRHGK